MIYEYRDYRLFLKESLTKKLGAGARQSIRSFSAKAGISNSMLSEVLNSRKALSMELAFKIAIKLGLSDRETQYFCLLVQFENEVDPQFKDEIQKRMHCLSPKDPAHHLAVDQFKIIAEWFHLAILELTQLPSFQLDSKWIAQKIGISKIQAEIAIERLLRLELIEIDNHGKAKKANSYLLTEAKIPTAAVRGISECCGWVQEAAASWSDC